jgi:hypothetical protein
MENNIYKMRQDSTIKRGEICLAAILGGGIFCWAHRYDIKAVSAKK